MAVMSSGPKINPPAYNTAPAHHLLNSVTISSSATADVINDARAKSWRYIVKS